MKLFRPVYALLALPGGALAANYDFFVLGQPAGNGNLQSTGDTSVDPAGEREGKPNESRSKDLEQGSTGPDYNVYYPRKQSTHLLPAVQQYSLKASPCAGEGAGQYIPSLSQSPSQPLQQYAPVHSTGEALGGSEASWKLPPHKASTETTLSQPSSSSEMETLSQTNPQQFIPVYGGNLLQPRPRLPGCDLDLPEPQKQKGCLVHSELRPSIILILSWIGSVETIDSRFTPLIANVPSFDSMSNPPVPPSLLCSSSFSESHRLAHCGVMCMIH